MSRNRSAVVYQFSKENRILIRILNDGMRADKGYQTYLGVNIKRGRPALGPECDIIDNNDTGSGVNLPPGEKCML